jgi:dynein heavy chain
MNIVERPQAKETAAEIEVVRSRYMPAAKRGSILFFVMACLSAINSMYEYALSAFLVVFQNSLDTSKKDSALEGRLRNIIDANTFDVYNYTCLGLFEKHKLMLSFQMTIKILEGEGEMNQEYLTFFLKGSLRWVGACVKPTPATIKWGSQSRRSLFERRGSTSNVQDRSGPHLWD